MVLIGFTNHQKFDFPRVEARSREFILDSTFILISSGTIPSYPLVAAAICLNIFGVFLHFVSDAQKYYTLKYQPGLITEGFFALCRNTNYLGEILIYSAFAMLTQHWLSFLIFGGFIIAIFIPNMLKKDKSLSRYPEFNDYKRRSGLLFPLLFVPKPADLEEKKPAI